MSEEHCVYCILFVCARVSRGVCVVILTGPNGVVSLSSLLGDITQKGYEKKRAKLLASYIQQLPSKTDLTSVFRFSSSRPASLFPVSFSHHLSVKKLQLNKSHLEVGRQPNIPLNRKKYVYWSSIVTAVLFVWVVQENFWLSVAL